MKNLLLAICILLLIATPQFAQAQTQAFDFLGQADLPGGVGGTLTVLCYGYWIREEGRIDMQQMRTCRVDLGVGYVMTAVFGVCMVILGLVLLCQYLLTIFVTNIKLLLPIFEDMAKVPSLEVLT